MIFVTLQQHNLLKLAMPALFMKINMGLIGTGSWKITYIDRNVSFCRFKWQTQSICDRHRASLIWHTLQKDSHWWKNRSVDEMNTDLSLYIMSDEFNLSLWFPLIIKSISIALLSFFEVCLYLVPITNTDSLNRIEFWTTMNYYIHIS